MKINASSKLLITSLAIVFLSILSGLVVNLLTSDTNLGQWLKDNNIGTRELVIGVVLSGLALLGFTYLQLRYTQQSEQANEKENLAEDIEPDVKRYYESLMERYRKRYESKLDGRFEITLEVSENWDGENTQKFKGEYEGKGQINEAFEYIRSAFEKQGRLLIVGSPGVGKTVLLLKLALELLEKADIEKKEAFPVIFNLASWSAEYKNFSDWLISVLNSGEGLSKDFAGKLLQEERILLLLDGLDELARNEDEETAAKIRAECLQSLNDYLDRGKKAVICCREKEFELMQKLTGRDAPVSAKVKINDLSEAEVLNTLMKVEEDKTDKAAAANLLRILKKDENNAFLKVLSTPFYFTTALEVFDKQIFKENDLPKDAKDLENYLRREFIEKKLNKTPNQNKFDKEKIKKWLIFLAELLNRKNLTTFELADLQPDELHNKRLYKFISGLLVGLGFLFYFYLLGNSLLFSFILFVPLVIFASKYRVFRYIETHDIVSMKYTKILSWNFWKPLLIIGLLFGIAIFIILWIGTSSSLFSLSFRSFMVGLSVILLILTTVGYERAKVISKYIQVKKPYQRFISTFILRIIELAVGLFIILLTASTMNIPTVYLSMIFLFSMLDFLDDALVRHIALRFCLFIENKVPLKYATFLDYAAEARILEKDGGHWRFRHQNLQDYFANLDE